eukprot:4066552-Pyramimonas_sp.AAC.1
MKRSLYLPQFSNAVWTSHHTEWLYPAATLTVFPQLTYSSKDSIRIVNEEVFTANEVDVHVASSLATPTFQCLRR